MTKPMILGWDFCVAHRAMVDANVGFWGFNGTSAPLFKWEELIRVPSMVRLRERTQITARSEKAVVAQLQENRYMANGLDIPGDPVIVFVDDEGLAIPRTVSWVKVIPQYCIVHLYCAWLLASIARAHKARTLTVWQVSNEAKLPREIKRHVSLNKPHNFGEIIIIFEFTELKKKSSSGKKLIEKIVFKIAIRGCVIHIIDVQNILSRFRL